MNDKSLNDNSAVEDWLNLHIGQSSEYQRRISLGAVNAGTGEYHIFDQDNTEFGSELAKAAKASGSFAPIWPPTEINS